MPGLKLACPFGAIVGIWGVCHGILLRNAQAHALASFGAAPCTSMRFSALWSCTKGAHPAAQCTRLEELGGCGQQALAECAAPGRAPRSAALGFGLAAIAQSAAQAAVRFVAVAGLPAGKPRYVMGVGYPLDIVVCSALGADMYDR